MNYEEILNAREAAGGKGIATSVGVLRQQQIDQKYRYVLKVKPLLADDAAFLEALRASQSWSIHNAGPNQLQYELTDRSTLLLEHGAFQTLAQLLDNNPAIVATPGFTEGIATELMDYASGLHDAGVFQLCFAPQDIFIRRGSGTPLMLLHGSMFSAVRNQKSLFEGAESYVAPEVLAGEKPTEASDVYALGRIIEFLCDKGGMPVEYKMLLKKATADNPAQRFQTVRQMKSALTEKRGMKRSLIGLAAALAIALLCVWIYVGWVPQRKDVEFIKPAQQQTYDPFDQPYDPDVQMVLDGDTIQITDEDLQMYTQKAEQIFRRRYEEAAEKKLAKLFDKENMSANEKAVLADSKAMQDQLAEMRSEMAEDIGIDPQRAEEIAREVVEKKVAKKKKQQEELEKELQSDEEPTATTSEVARAARPQDVASETPASPKPKTPAQEAPKAEKPAALKTGKPASAAKTTTSGGLPTATGQAPRMSLSADSVTLGESCKRPQPSP